MKKTAGEEGHSLLDMLRKRAFRRLGKFKKATKEGLETQPEPAPIYHYTSCSGSNRNNAKVLLRDTYRLGCPGEPHHPKESILQAAERSGQRDRRSKGLKGLVLSWGSKIEQDHTEGSRDMLG